MAVACAGSGRAAAAPLEPTLDLQQLQALLDASGTGTVNGYFLTVDKGSHIARIPMTVDAIEDNAGPDGALILFQADMTDPVMAIIGNIAGGMSGSPLYVQDGGVDKLIGALSYGDAFTLAGYGMATPIEYMSAIEARYPTATATRNAQTTSAAPRTYATTLQQPVAAGGGAVNRIVVAPSLAAAAADGAPRRHHGVRPHAERPDRWCAVRLQGLPGNGRRPPEARHRRAARPRRQLRRLRAHVHRRSDRPDPLWCPCTPSATSTPATSAR